VLEDTCSESIELLSEDMQYIRFVLSLIDTHWLDIDKSQPLNQSSTSPLQSVVATASHIASRMASHRLRKQQSAIVHAQSSVCLSVRTETGLFF